MLEFEVIGAPGSSTALQISTISLNDGAIRVQTADGSSAVNLVYRVSGAARYWNGSGGVPGVSLTLREPEFIQPEQQQWHLHGGGGGGRTLNRSKSDEVNGISAYDASLALQHDAGLMTLSGHAATAARCEQERRGDGPGCVLHFAEGGRSDHVAIPGAGVVWDFSPASRSIPNLNSDQSGHDFTAILLGDVSGNWAAAAPTRQSVLGGGQSSVVSGQLSAQARISQQVNPVKLSVLLDTAAPPPANGWRKLSSKRRPQTF